ncbi:hypothetical protein CU097_011484 [Rhizopus azygosporus]|uniref:Uncharacterized protein n=1 Tax=Rhizopus azygosporus TaxID=86630 RepID=A0A367JTG5_RHIAZ|nr:hypothetical protein CU097_011484 [Rhizopus azygosporus]
MYKTEIVFGGLEGTLGEKALSVGYEVELDSWKSKCIAFLSRNTIIDFSNDAQLKLIGITLNQLNSRFQLSTEGMERDTTALHNATKNMLPLYEWTLLRQLAEERFIFEPTVENDLQGNMATMLDQGTRRSPDNSNVDDTVLVVHADKAENDHPADKNEDKKLDFDCLEVIKHKREEDGIATDTQNFLNQQIRPSMSKLYGYGWRVFVN